MAEDLVLVRVNGKTVPEAIAENRISELNRLSAALVTVTRLAKTIRQRAQRGDFATKRRPYRTGGKWDSKQGMIRKYFISKGYAQATGAPFRKFFSSAHFHKVIGRQTAGNISGGMWRGLEVRNFGTNGALIEFKGKSVGALIKKTSRGYNQNVKIGNKRKAKTVLLTLKVNVIQPKDSEIEALGSAAVEVLGQSIAFGAPVTVQPSGDRALARALVDDIRTGRVTRYL